MYDAGNVLSAQALRLRNGFSITVLGYACFGLLVFALGFYMFASVKHVAVSMGDKTVSYLTFAPTVQDLVKEVGIQDRIGLDRDPASLTEGEIVEYYSVSHDLTARVTDGMNIRVYKNRVTKVTNTESIPAPIKRKWDVFIDPGREKVIDQGSAGIRKNTFLVHYQDGAMVSRAKTDSMVVSSPRPRIVAIGSYETASRQVRTAGGRPVKFVSTAYTHTGYRTATGAKTRRGIVAVDPKVIPLGTHLYIQGYGYGVAADTGGVIKGRKIDVFFETREEALQWGRRTVNVQILEGGGRN